MLPGVEVTTDTRTAGQTYAMHMNVIGMDDIIDRAKKAGLIEGLPNHAVASAIRESREMSKALARNRGNPSFICMVRHVL